MLNSLSVANRLRISFSTLLGLLALIAFGAIFAIRSLGNDLREVAGQDMQALEKAAVLQVAVLQIGNGVRDLVAQEDLKVMKESLKLIAENRKLAEQAQTDLASLIDSADGEEKAALQLVAKELPIYVNEVGKAAELVDSAEYDAAKRYIVEKIRPVQNRLDAGIAGFFRHVTEQGNTQSAQANARVRTSQGMLVVVTLIAVAAGLGMSWLISRSIVLPLQSALDFARRVSNGDLSGSIHAEGKDEVSTLVQALERMRQNLAELIGRINEEGNRVAHLARDLSSRTGVAEEQVSVQNERIMAVSAAMEEMSVSVSAVSDSAGGVSDASREAQELTRAGNQVMQHTLLEVDAVLGAVSQSSELVRELAESVENIRGMAKVIKEIADQTNLLALNAAIEAARAGEQGRGFAVVADEVRKLAERTGTSTADIASKVNEISGRTLGAVEAMNRVRSSMEADANGSRQVGNQLQQILVAAEKVSVLARHIADASREQATGSHQTARNVEEIANISENTHDAIRQAGKSAAEMSHTAETLQQLVSRFRLS